ncbi:hypothetical protein VIM7927_00874 [Vibrio mangrovi]|nr:hypothetical protein VIM7927_00874 [Vibrio mangrovi]
MGCCNTPPPGGTKEVGPLLKLVGILFVAIVLIAWVFG